MLGRAPTLIPAGCSVILEGSAEVPCHAGDCWAARATHKVLVVVMNTSGHEIAIPPWSVLAELGGFHSILLQHQVKPAAEVQKGAGLTFTFGDSPLSAEWKECITLKLCAMSEVFFPSMTWILGAQTK